MADMNIVLEGSLKHRDGKKWKSRWCIIRKLSPVADRLHISLYRDAHDCYKSGPEKANLPLEDFFGIESGFSLDKEPHVMAIVCKKEVVLLAFQSRELLIQWEIRIRSHLGEEQQYPATLLKAPQAARLPLGPVKLYIQGLRLCLTAGTPPSFLTSWHIADLRKFGVVDEKFCFVVGSRGGRDTSWTKNEHIATMAGVYAFLTEQGEEITEYIQQASQGTHAKNRRTSAKRRSVMSRQSVLSPVPVTPVPYLETNLLYKDFEDNQVHGDLNFVTEQRRPPPDVPVGPPPGPLVETTSTVFSDSSYEMDRRKANSIEKLGQEELLRIYQMQHAPRPPLEEEEELAECNNLDASEEMLRCSELPDTETVPKQTDCDEVHMSPVQGHKYQVSAKIGDRSVKLLNANYGDKDSYRQCAVFSNSSSSSSPEDGDQSTIQVSHSGGPLGPKLSTSSWDGVNDTHSHHDSSKDGLSGSHTLPRCSGQRTVFESHGKLRDSGAAKSMEMLEEILMACKLEQFSNSGSSHSSTRDLTVRSIHSSTCSIGSLNNSEGSPLHCASPERQVYGTMGSPSRRCRSRTHSCSSSSSSPSNTPHNLGSPARVALKATQTSANSKGSHASMQESPTHRSPTASPSKGGRTLRKVRTEPSMQAMELGKPLHYVDFNQYDGRDESYLYWVKGQPGAAPTISSKPHRYENIPDSELVASRLQGQPATLGPLPEQDLDHYIHMSVGEALPHRLHTEQDFIKFKCDNELPSQTWKVENQEKPVVVGSVLAYHESLKRPRTSHDKVYFGGKGLKLSVAKGNSLDNILGPSSDSDVEGEKFSLPQTLAAIEKSQQKAVLHPQEGSTTEGVGERKPPPLLPRSTTVDIKPNTKVPPPFANLATTFHKPPMKSPAKTSESSQTAFNIPVNPTYATTSSLATVSGSPISQGTISSTSSSPSKYGGAGVESEYMPMKGFNKSDDEAIFCTVELPSRRADSFSSYVSSHSFRSRNTSMSSNTSGELLSPTGSEEASYVDMSIGKDKRTGSRPFGRSHSAKEMGGRFSRPCMVHSKSLDNELEDNYLEMNVSSSSLSGKKANGDYMCMSPPNSRKSSLPISAESDSSAKPMKPFDNLIERQHYGRRVSMPLPTRSLTMDSMFLKSAAEAPAKSGEEPTKSKGFLSKLIRRNSSKEKDKKSLAVTSKSQEDILASTSDSQSLHQVASSDSLSSMVPPPPPAVPGAVDPFGLGATSSFKRRGSTDLLSVPEEGGDFDRERSSSSATESGWSETANLTDEQKQKSCSSLASSGGTTCGSAVSESPACSTAATQSLRTPGTVTITLASPVTMMESPAYMLITPGALVTSTTTLPSSPMTISSYSEPPLDTTLTDISVMEEEAPPRPPSRPQRARPQSAKSYSSHSHTGWSTPGGAGRQGGVMSQSSDALLTDDSKVAGSRSSLRSPPLQRATRGTLPRTKREAGLTVTIPRAEQAETTIWVQRDIPIYASSVGSEERTPVIERHRTRPRLGSATSETPSASSVGSSDTQSTRSDDHKVSPASTTLRPRFGKEYQRLDRRKLADDLNITLGEPRTPRTPHTPRTPQSPSVASSVFTFDVTSTASSRMSFVSGFSSYGEDSPRSPSLFKAKEHDYVNVGLPRDRTDSPRFIEMTPPGSPRSLSGMSEVSNPLLNYAEIDLTHMEDHRRPRKPRGTDIEYAMIDMIATAAASRVGKEHAQLREDSLRRKDSMRKSQEEAKEHHRRQKERKGSSSSSKEKRTSSSASRSGSKDRKLSAPT